MARILSQDEVDALLKGMNTNEVETETDNSGSADGVKHYDLTSQDRIIRGRMPTLEIINDRFARYFQQTMATATRKMVAISSGTVAMKKFGEFTRGLPVPTSIHVFKADPLRGHAIMVIDAKLVFNLVECFFGGSGRGYIKVEGRDFTPIESRLITKIIKMALEDLERAWTPVHPLTLSYVRGETNPQFASVVAPSEVVTVVDYEFELEQTGGTLTICLPYSTIEPIRSKLYAGFQSDQLEVDTAWINRFIERVREAEVNMVVEMGRTMITGEDMMNLAIGDVIMLKHDAREPLYVQVEGVPKFKVYAGTSRGQKAVRVVGDIPPKIWEE